MNKNIKILIIGFGSIGKRHYQNLLSLGYKNVFVYDNDKNIIKDIKLKINKLDTKNLSKFDIALICSPNNLHIEHALKCARAGCHIFIEKPLSHNMKGIKELEKICKKNKLINMVACNMRFHPSLIFIKKYLDKQKLGKVYSINNEFAYYLPLWRKGKDYRKNYAVSKKTGGGIILDDIHEFDLLFWLNDFNETKESNFIYSKVSNLEIETEDICVASFKFKNNLIATVRCDYLQQYYSRNCKIIGEKGNLEWDFKENIVWLKNKNGIKKLFEIKDFDFNSVYVDELKYFLNCVRQKKETYNSIKIAEKVLKYCFERK